MLLLDSGQDSIMFVSSALQLQVGTCLGVLKPGVCALQSFLAISLGSLQLFVCSLLCLLHFFLLPPNLLLMSLLGFDSFLLLPLDLCIMPLLRFDCFTLHSCNLFLVNRVELLNLADLLHLPSGFICVEFSELFRILLLFAQ